MRVRNPWSWLMNWPFYQSRHHRNILLKGQASEENGHLTRMEEGKGAFKILTGNSTGKKLRGKLRRGSEENIR